MSEQAVKIRAIEATIWALENHTSRETVVRKIQRGLLRGARENGRWIVYEKQSE